MNEASGGSADKKFWEIMKIIYESSAKMDLVRRLRSKLNLEYVKKNLEYVEENLKTKNALLCDLGCQTGYITAYLSSRGYEVVGVDVNCPQWQGKSWKKFMVRYGCSFVIGDGNHLPLRDGLFKAVVAYAFIEHVRNGGSALSEINRILDVNGLLFIFGLPRKSSYTEKLAALAGWWHHEVAYDMDEISSLLEKHGFKILDLKWSGLVPVSLDLWNRGYMWLLLYYLDRILVKTPLKALSHSFTIVVNKTLKDR